MKILVSTITGKKVEISAESVSELQSSIASEMGIPIEEQKLLSNGKILSDDNLSSNVQLIISLEGGAKGKKKKAAAKKTKKKHVHKKVKLRILSYYKVDGDKVSRLRRMCEVCPPGTFLAEHDDRYRSSYQGYWSLGIADWRLGIRPNPQSPIPNPQSPIPNPQSPFVILIKIII